MPAELDSLVPASYVARWLALLEARGVDVAAAVAGTGITVELFADPNARLPMPALLQVMGRGAALAGDPSLGLELGLALKPTTHSWFGLAVMSASTLGAAIELGNRYLGTRAGPLRVHLHQEGPLAYMVFEEMMNLGPARVIVLECILGGVIRMGEFLLGHSFTHPDLVFHCSYPEPAYHARFRDRIPRIVYDAKKLQAVFPVAWLERPLAFAEPVVLSEAVTALDQELKQLGGSEEPLDRTRALLAACENGFPDLEAAAAQLAMSSRTLRRHLHARGTSYHALRDEARRARAITLLSNTVVPLEAIARELGYADVPSFARAFQRWTQLPPSRYRRDRLGGTGEHEPQS